MRMSEYEKELDFEMKRLGYTPVRKKGLLLYRMSVGSHVFHVAVGMEKALLYDEIDDRENEAMWIVGWNAEWTQVLYPIGRGVLYSHVWKRGPEDVVRAVLEFERERIGVEEIAEMSREGIMRLVYDRV